MHQISLEEFFRRLHSHAQRGLNSSEAAERLRHDGLNALIQRKKEPELLKFMRQLTNLFALLLWCGAGLSLGAEYLLPGQGSLAIAIALIGVVLLNGIFSYWQGHKAEAIMESFREIRFDGHCHTLPLDGSPPYGNPQRLGQKSGIG